MARSRLINCDFMNNMTKVSNSGKLLYFMLFVNADDKGFVGNGEEIVRALSNNDKQNYDKAVEELVSKGLIYEFKSNYDNNVYLIRHWYYHNHFKNNLWSNYQKYLLMVDLENGEYLIREKERKPLKEIKTNEIKLNEIKKENENESSINDEEKFNQLIEELERN